MNNIPILKYLLTTILCLALCYFEIQSAIIYLPIAIFLVFILGFFNSHIFKLGIDRFSFLGILLIIGCLIGVLLPTNFTPSMEYYRLSGVQGIKDIYTIINANLDIFTNNINIKHWFVALIIAPIIWAVNNEIFINNIRKKVFLDSLMIEHKHLISTNKYLYVSFYLLWLIFAGSVNILIFGYVAAALLLICLLKLVNADKYVYLVNLMLVLLFGLFFAYDIKYGIHYSIADGLSLINYIHTHEKFSYWFLNFKAHKLLYISVYFANILITIFSLIILKTAQTFSNTNGL